MFQLKHCERTSYSYLFSVHKIKYNKHRWLGLASWQIDTVLLLLYQRLNSNCLKLIKFNWNIKQFRSGHIFFSLLLILSLSHSYTFWFIIHSLWYHEGSNVNGNLIDDCFFFSKLHSICVRTSFATFLSQDRVFFWSVCLWCAHFLCLSKILHDYSLGNIYQWRNGDISSNTKIKRDMRKKILNMQDLFHLSFWCYLLLVDNSRSM